MSNVVDAAIRIARAYHAGHVDKAGVDYFEGHLSAVANAVDGELERAVGFLHDVIEDSDLDRVGLVIELVCEGVPLAVAEEIAEAVEVLSKVDGEAYDRYLERVRANPLARAVKIADLGHNSDLSRLDVVRDRDVKRAEKYARALAFLAA